jgi:hypothetical protein
VPGTGEIGAGVDVARMVLQIMGDGKSAEEAVAQEAEVGSQPAGDPAQMVEQQATQEPKPDLPTQALRLGTETIVAEAPSKSESAAGHKSERTAESQRDSAAPQQPVRRHGSAKPLD